MAGKSGSKGKPTYDFRNHPAMANTSDISQEQLKEKIAKVREVVPSRSNDDICLVLRNYEYDVDQAINAFVEDGAVAALKEWNHTGNNKGKGNNKNKKRNKKKTKKETSSSGSNQSSTVVNDVDDASSCHSNYVEIDEDKVQTFEDPEEAYKTTDSSDLTSSTTIDTTMEEIPDATSRIHNEPCHLPTLVGDSPRTQTALDVSNTLLHQEELSRVSGEPLPEREARIPRTHGVLPEPHGTKYQSKELSQEQSSDNKTLPLQHEREKLARITLPDAHDSTKQPKDIPEDETPPSGSSFRQESRYRNKSSSAAGSGTRSTTSLSEEHVAQASSFNSTATTTSVASLGKRALEKSLKDLSRQTVALQRVQHLLEEEINNSYRRLKSAFQEVQKLMGERQMELEKDMEKVKNESLQLLTQRQELASELKLRSQRVPVMSEVELSELRSDIKLFVVERKLDEELGKTLRFVWDKDRITQEMKNFGEIIHVKNNYTQRRPSVSSVSSSNPEASSSVPTPLPNITATNGLDAPSPDIAAEPQQPSQRPDHATNQPHHFSEGRARVFSNRGRYNMQGNQSNRGYLGGGRGNRGRGDYRPRGQGWRNFGYNYHSTSHVREDGSADYVPPARPYVRNDQRMQGSPHWERKPRIAISSSSASNSTPSKLEAGSEGQMQEVKSSDAAKPSLVNGLVQH